MLKVSYLKSNNNLHALDNYKPKPNEDWQLHWLDDQPMLFSKSHEGLHLLNPVAGFIWTCCDGKTDVRAIREALQEVFVDNQNEVVNDLPNILTLWQKQGLMDVYQSLSLKDFKIRDTRKIIYYPEANLQDLDAGVVVAYPLPAEHRSEYAYYVVPSFLIIGAQKCGTRELHTWLSMHPKLRGPIRECHFFNEVIDIEAEWMRYIINPSFLISKNKAQFFSDTIHTFEKTPAYLDKANRGIPVPKLIQKIMPSGKFIVLLRNPTERAYSAYQMGRETKGLSGSIPEYVNNDFLSVIKRRLSTTYQEPYEELLNLGHYALHLETWFRYFSRGQLLVLLLEDFKQEPFSMMEQILAFLELPDFDYRSQAEKNFRGLWVLKGRHSKGNRLPYEPMPKEAKFLLDKHYKPWNERLKQLIPELNISW